MANERIDIEIVDKVSPAIGQKLEKIAAAAREANAHIVNLQKALSAVKPAQINNLATAETKAAIAAKKLEQSTASAATAQQRLVTEVQRTAAAESKAISATVKLETEQKKLAAETQKAAAAQSRAEQAALRLKNAQDKAAKSASRSSFSFGAMKGVLIGVVAAVGSLWAALSVADEFANLQNRLRSTGLEGEGLNDVMRRLTESANNSRSSLAGTVELYSRLAVSSSELGVTQEQLIGFTTSLNQAILLSGANAAEAQAGLIQLSQGMASGTLRGDELRSVLEQLPAVADVIAKSMGVTRGQLRELGADGKISAQTILKAFQEAGPELGERFAKQASTAGQALTVLGNTLKTTLGEELKGTLQVVSDLLLLLAKNTNELLMVVKALAIPLTAIVALNFARWLGQTQIAMTLMSTATAGGATGMLAFRNAMQLTISTAAGLVAVLGVAYYAYQKINEAANQRQEDEDALARRKATQAADDVVATLKQERGKLKEQNRLTEGWQAERYKLEREKRLAAIDILNKEILRAEKQANATRAVENGTSADEWLNQLEAAKKKAETLTKPIKDASLKPAAEQIVSPVAASEVAKVQEANYAYSEVAKVQEANYAYSEITAQIDEMFTTLGMTDRQLSIHNKLLEYSAQIPQDANSKAMLDVFEKQLSLYYDQADAIQKRNEALERQKQILESVKRTDFNTAMGDLASLGSRISPEQRQDYLISQNADLFAGTAEAIQANLKNYEDMYARIDAMREADDISQTTASQMRLKVWIAENEAKLQTASEFFSGFAALQTSTWSELAEVGKAAAIAQATIDGILAVQKALAAYPPPVSYAMAASAGVAAAVNVAKIKGVAGFETGGYTGNVGTSSVAGVVHGQEYVMDADTVRRVGVDSLDAIRSGAAMIQQPSGPVIGSGNQNQTQNVNQTRIVNVIDPALVGDWMNTPDGERAILNIIRNNADTMRQTVNG